jgi:fructose-specific phosphotransferase system IIC component
VNSGLITLIVLAILCAYCIRWVSQRMRLPAPAYLTVILVFVLVVAALYGRTLG